MAETSAADDLTRFLGLGSAWDFTPPLPPQWARRLRNATATHPAGARIEIGWTLSGEIAGRTRWQGADGQIVDFETIVPAARGQVFLALLGNPESSVDRARSIVRDCVRSFWSEEPYRLSVRGEIEHELSEEFLARIESRIDRRRHLQQRWARLRGWRAPSEQ